MEYFEVYSCLLWRIIYETLCEPVSNEEYLANCLHEEIIYREEKAKLRRVKQACLPTHKAFETFDTEFNLRRESLIGRSGRRK